MKICYVDEAGCTGAFLSNNPDIQPVFAITGLIIDSEKIRRMTDHLIEMKEKFYPKKVNDSYKLSRILFEIKGSDLRKEFTTEGRQRRRHIVGYLDQIFLECREIEAKIIGRIWVKGVDQEFNGRSVYTSSIQRICEYFQHYLGEVDDLGIIVADSRLKKLNSEVSHSIFTEKFRSAGDKYDRIIELPMFAHSDNHAGLQICDTIVSGIVYPIAIETYVNGMTASPHIKTGYCDLKSRYMTQLKSMQYRFQLSDGTTKGGIVVSDSLGHRPGGDFFR